MKVTKEILLRAGLALDNWQERAWTVQGFGMIRTYLDDEKRWRLNVWDEALKVPNVSEIHDHPWDFQSWVLCGRLVNTRFTRAGVEDPLSLPYQHVEIKTGEGGGPTGPVDVVRLFPNKPENYEAGEGYRQNLNEIHITKARSGTVTLNDRTPPTLEYTANIYWPRGPWVNAEPRPATKAEVFNAVSLARRQAELARLL